jgi:hypothetical protein
MIWARESNDLKDWGTDLFIIRPQMREKLRQRGYWKIDNTGI